ncbi:MAG: SPOR domain-containing protein [Alphaproteobacteria bacterium]|nr:SPOR domain-containing protein [Alphaproteobacteria bacterium]
MYLSRPALIVLMSLLATPAFAQDIGAGVEAYGRGDYDRALREWRPLAERGDSEAQAGLGLMHARGQGVRQDYIEAIRWFRLSAAQGSAIGQSNLGLMYRNGHGVRQDYSEAVLMYRLSAAQGYALAQGSLGAMYQNGDGIRRDYVEAYMWYTLAAEQGHESANQARTALEPLLSVDQRSQALTRVIERQRRTADARPPKRTDLVDSAASPEVAADEPSANAPALLLAPLNAPGETAPEAPVLAISAPVPIVGGAAWRIQLASLNSRNDTEAEWTRLQLANSDLLRGLMLHVQQAELSKGTFYRVQAGPLKDQATAASLCNSLKSRNQDCLIVVP